MSMNNRGIPPLLVVKSRMLELGPGHLVIPLQSAFLDGGLVSSVGGPVFTAHDVGAEALQIVSKTQLTAHSCDATLSRT